jgi:hypothetical protein
MFFFIVLCASSVYNKHIFIIIKCTICLRLNIYILCPILLADTRPRHRLLCRKCRWYPRMVTSVRPRAELPVFNVCFCIHAADRHSSMPLIPLIFGFLICTRIDHLCPWVIVESQCKVVNNFAKKSQPKALSVVGDTAQWWSTCQSLGSIPSTGKKKVGSWLWNI